MERESGCRRAPSQQHMRKVWVGAGDIPMYAGGAVIQEAIETPPTGTK
jgi:hypothetical protein